MSLAAAFEQVGLELTPVCKRWHRIPFVSSAHVRYSFHSRHRLHLPILQEGPARTEWRRSRRWSTVRCSLLETQPVGLVPVRQIQVQGWQEDGVTASHRESPQIRSRPCLPLHTGTRSQLPDGGQVHPR